MKIGKCKMQKIKFDILDHLSGGSSSSSSSSSSTSSTTTNACSGHQNTSK